MRLSRKEFKITQLVDNREEFVINEFLYILGVNFSYCWHSVDGLNGDIPFTYLSNVESKKEELEQLEEVESRYRDGSVMLFLIFAVVVFYQLLLWVV